MIPTVGESFGCSICHPPLASAPSEWAQGQVDAMKPDEKTAFVWTFLAPACLESRHFHVPLGNYAWFVWGCQSRCWRWVPVPSWANQILFWDLMVERKERSWSSSMGWKGEKRKNVSPSGSSEPLLVPRPESCSSCPARSLALGFAFDAIYKLFSAKRMLGNKSSQCSDLKRGTFK